jgi:hypothetical protein
VAALAMLGAGPIAAGGASPAGARATDIVIGVLSPRTGAWSSLGEAGEDAADELAVGQAGGALAEDLVELPDVDRRLGLAQLVPEAPPELEPPGPSVGGRDDLAR